MNPAALGRDNEFVYPFRTVHFQEADA